MSRKEFIMSEKKNELTRRDLIKGVIIGTGAIAVSGILPEKSEAAKIPKKWDLEADVVVVGYGGAGAAAAITAHDAGAKVLMLEKAPGKYKGGSTRVSGNLTLCPNNVDKAIIYFKAMSGPYQDNISDEMWRAFTTEMVNNTEWLKKIGADLVPFALLEFPDLPGADSVVTYTHKKGPLGEARLWDQVIEPAVASRKINVLYETPAKSLIKRDQEILGVTAERKGKTIQIKAKKAVILTCGGFENNQTMVRNYLPDMPYCYPMGTPYNTGDGITMAMDVGADLWHMTNIAGPYFYFKTPDIPVSSRIRVQGKSYIFVARDASRFVAEAPTLIYENGKQIYPEKHGKIYRHGRYVQNPTPVPIHIVFDESTRKAGALCGKAAGWTWSWDVIYGDLYNWSKDNTREIEKGWIKKADNIRDLAKAVNLSPDSLEKTVNRYNKLCQDGADTDFDRRAQSMAPIQTPPFYIMELTPTFINTQGGPRRNKNAQIMSVNDKPISRLYSAGELGSIWGFQYQGGGNVGECFAFGRIAGRNASKEKNWK